MPTNPIDVTDRYREERDGTGMIVCECGSVIIQTMRFPMFAEMTCDQCGRVYRMVRTVRVEMTEAGE